MVPTGAIIGCGLLGIRRKRKRKRNSLSTGGVDVNRIAFVLGWSREPVEGKKVVRHIYYPER